MDRKAVSPVIAIVLLLMMTVAAAGAAYFWITSMQSSIQESSYKSIENIMEASGRRVIAQATLCKPTYPYKGLVGYWMMDEGSGSYANDSSGNENDGTIYGAEWTSGKIGDALKFNGSDTEDLKVPLSSSLQIGMITFSTWVYLHNTSNRELLIEGAQGDSGFMIYNRQDLDTIDVWLGNGTNSNLFRGGNELPEETWINLAVVYEGNVLDVYRNGEQYLSYDSSLGKLAWSQDDLYLGSGWTHSINGTLDEVRIYNRALSENEIKELYDAENHSARRRIDVTVRNIGSEEIPKATWVANLKHDGTNVETDAYNASAIDTGELATLKFYFKNFKPNTEYTIELQGTGTSTTVSC